jgi:shikimate kinase
MHISNKTTAKYLAKIVLIGAMGSGKSTLGKLLAARLQYKFLDSDTAIEQAQNMSVTDIFAQEGEDEFRKYEAQTIKNLIQSTDAMVIATGGGAILNNHTCSLLKAQAVVIWLDASADTLTQRLAADTTRPLLAGKNKLEVLTAKLAQRTPLYKTTADYIIDVTDKSPTQLIAEIEQVLDIS